MQGAQVRTQVKELRCPMPKGMVQKKKRPTDNLETGRHMKTEGDGVRKPETDQKEKLVLGVGEGTVSELGQKGRGGAGLGRRWVGP